MDNVWKVVVMDQRGWLRYVLTYVVVAVIGLFIMYFVFDGWSVKMVSSALGPATLWTAIIIRWYDLLRKKKGRHTRVHGPTKR